LNFISGGTFEIQCHALAHPKPTFTWRRDGVDVVTSERMTSDSTTGLLTISEATSSDSGHWECIAMNDQGIGTAVATLNYIGEAAMRSTSV